MSQEYLKVRTRNCPRCQEQNDLEVVVKGIMTNKRKEVFSTEKVIGYHCSHCNYQKPAKL